MAWYHDGWNTKDKDFIIKAFEAIKKHNKSEDNLPQADADGNQAFINFLQIYDKNTNNLVEILPECEDDIHAYETTSTVDTVYFATHASMPLYLLYPNSNIFEEDCEIIGSFTSGGLHIWQIIKSDNYFYAIHIKTKGGFRSKTFDKLIHKLKANA